jgi:hypothetical protein
MLMPNIRVCSLLAPFLFVVSLHPAQSIEGAPKLPIDVFLKNSDLRVVDEIKAPEKSELHTITWVNNERLVYEFAENNQYRWCQVESSLW